MEKNSEQTQDETIATLTVKVQDLQKWRISHDRIERFWLVVLCVMMMSIAIFVGVFLFPEV